MSTNEKKEDQLPTTQTPAQSKDEKNIADFVLARVNTFRETGELMMPANYSMENAVKSAYLILTDQTVDRGDQKVPVLSITTKASVANAILKMVTEGLSVAKRQGSFIPYGDKLTWQREYAGNVALAKRVAGLQFIKANVIYKDDKFDYEINADTGRRKLISHKQELKDVGIADIIGAYAIYSYKTLSGEIVHDMEVMTIQQIKNSWNMGRAKGNSKAHNLFTDQMCMKTVINRATKLLINTSDDSTLYADQGDDDDVNDQTEKSSQPGANSKSISLDEVQQPEVVATKMNGEGEGNGAGEEGNGSGNNNESNNPI